VERLLKDRPDAPEGPVLRALVLARMGRYDSAETAFREIAAAKVTPLGTQTALGGLFHLDVLRGRLADAERENERFRELSRSRQLKAGVLGAEARLALVQSLVLRDTAAARRTLAAAEARTPLDSIPVVDRPYVGLVQANARAGNLPRAKQLLAEYERVTPAGVQRDSADLLWMRTALAFGERRPRDVIGAVQALRTNVGCTRCGAYVSGLAWEALAQPDSAIAEYERSLGNEGATVAFGEDALTLPQVHRQLGTLYEARGERAKAVAQYTAFLDLWRGADAALQPQVREVKERLAGLVGEGGR
jgi:tetratricopeptide (TPR) repeat protein